MEYQPLKKRMVEQSTIASTNQRYPQNVQYIQYIPNTECKLETLQNVCQQASRQFYSQSQSQDYAQSQNTSQIVQFEHYEAPMMLNAWTQTSPDDFQPFNSGNQAALLTKIQQLEQKIETQSDLIEKLTKPNRRSLSPVTGKSHPSVTMSSEMMPIEYRIINQSDGPDNETQIEIEISSDSDGKKYEISSPPQNNHKENKSLNVEHMYAQNPKLSVAKSTRTNIEGPLVSIGPNDTKIPAVEFEKIAWISPSIATRKLLALIFDRETLATHSMTGKASPAFKDMDKPIKRKLDQNAVDDIIFVVTKKCGVSAKEVRTAITTKCADENKMLKLKAIKTTESPKSILTENNDRKIKRRS